MASRNKENSPLITTQRHDSLAPSLQNLPSEDFFTDSIIDDSRIPTPSPQKPRPVRPRRAVGISKALGASKDLGNRTHRSSLSEYTNSRTSKLLRPAPTLTRKKSPSPRRPNGLTTPPQPRHDSSLTTPTEEFSSPPHGLTDVYQRIADEEDLAATERDVDSDEDLEDEEDDALGTDVDADPLPGNQQSPRPEDLTSSSTPIQPTTDPDKESLIGDHFESISEPPTLDFVRNEMSDRVLAAKLTPHVIDRVKDRQRLERLRQSQRAIDFHTSPRSEPNGLDGEHRRNGISDIANRGPITFQNIVAAKANGFSKALSDTSADATPQKKLKAFSRATRNVAKDDIPEDDDGSDTPPELRAREKLVAFSKASRPYAQPDADSEPHAQDPKIVAFSRANEHLHGDGGSSGSQDRQQTEGDLTQSAASTASEPLPGNTPKSSDRHQATRSFLARWRQEAAKKRAEKKQEAADPNSSQIDWAAAAADVPMPSVEGSSTPQDTPPRDALASSVQKQRSIDRIRRWENDFTGLSFQVSESPPVRSRPNLNDSIREKEIENLAKQAVTANRLDKIREKDPNALVRKTSRSFSPEEPRRQAKQDVVPNQSQNGKTHDHDQGQAIPDTPVVVYRSSSTASERSKSSDRPTPESHKSLDHLQRLARAASTTPKASPPSQEPRGEPEEYSVQGDILAAYEGDDDDVPLSPPTNADKGLVAAPNKVMETPKVTGAWTDTILPDTVKTVKASQKHPKHLQTPHVNAGAWIDTPAPNSGVMVSNSIPMTIEEVTEELTNGIIPVDDQFRKEEQSRPASQPQVALEADEEAEHDSLIDARLVHPPSALTNVLNQAKQKRLVSRDITDVRDDTLNLGDATIQSFEDLLTDAADITADLTSLIKTGAEDEALRQRQFPLGSEGDSTTAEVAFIGHLTSRIERLMLNLHEARKGISRLEQKVSLTPELNEVTQVQAQDVLDGPRQPCTVCGTGGHQHLLQGKVNTNSWLPITYSTFTLPIPLLFYPRRQGQLIPRPTWLGWLTMTVWIWYFLECTMCEIYGHPLYAERYVWPAQPEPEFPFVLPTMLWRWSHMGTLASGLFGTLCRLVVVIYRVIGMSFGLTDGYVDDVRSGSGPQAALAQATKALEAANSVISGVGESMMNDEFI
ncbi:hypothetical protein LTR10_018147 [Elasticomyces elasticus]|uniref:Uncharacterized protein n=1 Tax=Exophiala sideris TaxID=1016849 RepID=A0ABR0IWD2_9EURO|nr:hypothetical protein LTR10_018147 [Elasticomyces elasticus]KAK5021744.1 hypothetical protein LTS07_010787 [Exophiala sideris]KAK5025099.1 hypothetical protein LTR13_010535 [Exophiala sideris]KAK5050176.1 hypothetical protein LTR69_010811 [Exophiala sideris]KAK5176924.1 hypothetical protein LTR44_010621 [Eurotiomycetes sp. CCFEE 6388]